MTVPPEPQGRETLADALQRAAAQLQWQAVPPLPPRLRAALRPPRAGARGGHRWRPVLAGAMALLLASALLLALPGDDRPAPVAQHAPPGASAFVAVADGRQLQQAAQAGDGQVWRVSTELPRERLAALGLPYDPSRAGERVRAELLVHASGDVLAVRVLQ
jgi:hypothetical protein